MTERLLQFIWQFQYFNKRQLQTTVGEDLYILYPGILNTNQGPDFSEAKIKIEHTVLVGHIELHLLSSQWFQHAHHTDNNYQTVVLHVVWQHDMLVELPNGGILSTLELQPLVSGLLLQQYESLIHSRGFVPCEASLPLLTGLAWMGWKERLAIERLTRKSKTVTGMLAESKQHWEEIFWWMLARNFGVTVNMDCFEQIARSIPVKLLAKHKNQLIQLEALLIGQAGLLEDEFKEDYPVLLQREYRFLKKKYQLERINITPAFLRMRPANFPTVRLAQLAKIIHHSSHLFSVVKEATDVEEIKQRLNVTANDYWHYHYRFEVTTEHKPKTLGEQMINNILINTVVPVLFAYGVYHKEQIWRDKAVSWLMQIPPEANTITKNWKQHGVTNQNAFDSQALLELKKYYCNEKRCLDCVVGNRLLKNL